jgi:MoCo/4Fe-4S cofactor protein with predicted Tat translocation signal
MKTIPPPCPETDTGHKYWRSLDQLADTPEFRQWVEREFPSGASELTDPVTRRDFVKIMSASFLLAGVGLTGCRKPEEHIYPFSKMPEGYVHGVPQYYATAMPTRGSAIPLLAKSNDGRPTKVEGNPNHPDSNGGTDRFAQASVLNLYDPDRASRFLKQGNAAKREEALDFLSETARKFQANGGEGLHFLLERSSSPSRSRLQKLISEKYPRAKWCVYEPIDFDIQRQAAALVFGKQVTPYYKLDEAEVIVSLDCDFIGAEQDAHINIRRFAKGRKITKSTDTMSRLYAVESLMTLTGANADHRLRVPPSAVAAVAARFGTEILKNQNDFITALQLLTNSVKDQEKWIVECAKDLLAHPGKSLVLAGHRQPLAVHAMVNALNNALGNVGKTVVFHDAPAAVETAISDLAQSLNANQVDTLVIVGGNPAYDAPADLDWTNIQKKAKTTLRLGYHEDETAALSTWHLPLTHYLESWGDARTSDGTLVSIQPLIEPLFGGLTEIEVLGRLAGLEKPSAYDIVRETFKGIGGEGDEVWKKFLHDGFLANSAAQPVTVQFNSAAAVTAIGRLAPPAAATLGRDNLEVIFHRDYSVDDGRYNNNGWLQELPDPITKMVWENVILVSVKTAEDLSLVVKDHENNKLLVPWVKLQLAGREVEGPVWIQPGQADNTVGLALGYGRKKTGRIGLNSGYDAYRLRTAAAPHFAVGGKLTAVGRSYQIACTQNHWSMEGRPIIREANLEQYKKDANFVKGMNAPHSPSEAPMYPNPLDEFKGKAHHQWGMAIDLNACVGCSACMIACQSENNIPIVGKDQVTKGRELHWIRIDRYYSGKISDPQVVSQPMLCQHCEAAPCESVCPVNATVHDNEGLNVMVYNRCVGTRYCSNNCPYKVRRFNYFDYNKRPLDKLYYGPLRKRPSEELEIIQLAKNPDVTVRMRGVMEKCTFCVQRIEQAKISQKVKAGASGNVIVPTDSFTTACAQACPAGAIVFGNIADPKSSVVEWKARDRNYTVLDFLATKPRLTYLAKVRNPNPAVPDDYTTMPGSFSEFTEKNGSHEAPHGAHQAPHGAPAGQAHGEAGKGAH